MSEAHADQADSYAEWVRSRAPSPVRRETPVATPSRRAAEAVRGAVGAFVPFSVAAKELGVSRQSLWRWARDGQIAPEHLTNVGRTTRVSRAWVNKMLRGSR